MSEARRDFLAYLRHVARDQDGNPLRQDVYTRLMADAFLTCQESGRHLSHVAFPGLGKSTLLRHFACWDKGRNPRNSTVIISGEKKIATGFCAEIRDLLQRPEYVQVFPEIRPDNSQAGDRRGKTKGWEKDRINLVHAGDGQSPDAAFEAVAAKPKGEARRVHMLIADDVMTRAIAASRSDRDDLKKAARQTWINGRLSNGGWYVGLQNCWHKEDLAHDLLSDPRFCSIWVGITAELDRLMVKIWNPPDTVGGEGLALLEDPESFEAEEVPPAFDGPRPCREFRLPLPDNPELYSPERFRAVEQGDSTTFRQLYRLQAASPEDRMFPHWFGRKTHPGTVAQMLGVGEEAGRPVFGKLDRMRFTFGGGFDMSSERRRGDSISFWARDTRGVRYPVEKRRGNFTAGEAAEIIQSAWLRGVRFGVFYVENNATQDKFLRELKIVADDRGYEWVHLILPFTTGRNKADATNGLPGMDVRFETGGIIWPAGESKRTDVAHAEAWRLTEGEYEECPRFPDEGATGDGVMSDWFAERALDRLAPTGGAPAKVEAVDVTRDAPVEAGWRSGF